MGKALPAHPTCDSKAVGGWHRWFESVPAADERSAGEQRRPERRFKGGWGWQREIFT